MSKRNVHIVPAGKGWQVKEAGRDEVISNHRSQTAALKVGKKLARKNESELVIHRPNGQIRDHDSYGNDPRSSIDLKH
ncbi:MAG TPA: DUF2188 domain-containing protein [Pirellulales bacterium]